MLAERYVELLTAYVDGELSGRQRRHVERLLRRSPEARRLLRQLQDDAAALGKLSRPRLPSDLSGKILHTIAANGLTPRRRRQPARPRFAVPAWAGLAAAAAVLLVLGLASYLCFTPALPGPSGPALAQKSANPPGHGSDQGNVKHSSELIAPPREWSGAEGPPKPESHPTLTPAEKDTVAEGPKTPPPPLEPEPELGSPKDHAGPVLTDRGMEIFEIKTVELTPPLIVAVHDLDQDAAGRKLQTELGKGDGFRLELPVADATRAMERLQSVCKSAGVNLLVEQVAQGRLKKPHWKTNFVVYAETLTPADLTRLLHALAVADKQALSKKPADGLLDRLVVTRMNRNDRRELADLLNVEPAQLQLSRASGPLGTDITRPLADQTTEQLAQVLTGQGKSPGKVPELPALALTMAPVRPNRGSTEIKRFLDGRKPVRPGTLQIMLVLRNVG